MGFDRFSDILKMLGQRYPALSKRIIEASRLGRWEKAVGPAIAKHTRAIRVEKGVLWVEVDHPIWKSELHHRKRQILEILNKPEPGSRITDAPLEDILLLDPRKQRPET
jgi:predicted nucleic acid-binding Zn ribbon protein